eukprot:923280-Rhodomonas_salina.1
MSAFVCITQFKNHRRTDSNAPRPRLHACRVWDVQPLELVCVVVEQHPAVFPWDAVHWPHQLEQQRPLQRRRKRLPRREPS